MAEEREVWRIELEDAVSDRLAELAERYRQFVEQMGLAAQQAATAAGAGEEAGPEAAPDELLQRFRTLQQVVERELGGAAELGEAAGEAAEAPEIPELAVLHELRPVELLRGPGGRIYSREQAEEFVRQRMAEGATEEEAWSWFTPEVRWRGPGGRFVGREQVAAALEAAEARVAEMLAPEEGAEGGGIGQTLAEALAAAIQAAPARGLGGALRAAAQRIMPAVEQWAAEVLWPLTHGVVFAAEGGAAAGGAAEAGAAGAGAAGAAGEAAAGGFAAAFSAMLPAAIAGAVAAAAFAIINGIVQAFERVWRAVQQEMRRQAQEAFTDALAAIDFEAVTGAVADDVLRVAEIFETWGVRLERILAQPLPLLRARFEAMGIEIRGVLEGQRSWLEVLEQVRERYQQTEQPLQRMLMLQVLFGQQWREVLPLMEMSEEQFRRMVATRRELQATADERELWTRWRMATAALRESLGRVLLLVVEPLIEYAVPVVEQVAANLQAGLHVAERMLAVARAVARAFGELAALLYRFWGWPVRLAEWLLGEREPRLEAPRAAEGTEEERLPAPFPAPGAEVVTPEGVRVQTSYGPQWWAQRIEIEVRPIRVEVTTREDWLEVLAEQMAEAEYRRRTRA